MTGSSTDLLQYQPPLAIYIHWPFCKKKCPYCDFNSHVREAVDHAAWREALLSELRYWHHFVPQHYVTSVFFGGGTPSLMAPETVAALLEEIARLWKCDPEIEITLEANPTSVETEKFVQLQQAGVNRISLGVQSLRPSSLTFLGRENSVAEALHAIELSARIFPRYSFDLIYALPDQTLAAWREELMQALAYAGGHLSVYQLTIEENTAFHHAYHVAKQFELPQDETAATLYQVTQECLEAAGLPAYEISNHARPGHASRHNLSYWKSDAYLGIGPGAHGRVDIGTTRYATRTLKSPERWLEITQRRGHGIEEETALDEVTRGEEYVLMGLRLTTEGIARSKLPSTLHQRLNDGRIEALVRDGLLDVTSTHIAATARGRLLLNYVTARLLAA